jgi:hypothetical protein
MTITTQQARQRFTTIPPRLQDAVFSEQTAEIMDGIAQQYHLTDEKAAGVGKIASYVLLGFLHPEDVAREIQAQVALPAPLAADISKSLDAKIFAALRDDLIKVYAPVPTANHEEESMGPKIIQQVAETIPVIPKSSIISTIPPVITKPTAAPAPKPSVATTTPIAVPKPAAPPAPTTPPKPPMPKISQLPLQSPPPMPAPPPRPPKQNLSGAGWSQQITSGPLSIGPKPAPAPTTPPPSPAPAPSAPPKPPAPVMLHEVMPASSTQMQKSADIKTDLGKRDQMKITAPAPQSNRPAVLEIGATPKAPEKSAVMPPTVPTTSSTGPRTITEVTSAPPQVPPAPSAPQTPPQSAKPPVPPPNYKK